MLFVCIRLSQILFVLGYHVSYLSVLGCVEMYLLVLDCYKFLCVTVEGVYVNLFVDWFIVFGYKDCCQLVFACVCVFVVFVSVEFYRDLNIVTILR